MKMRAVVEFDCDAQAFSATCPELNYVSSCGATKDEVMRGLQEAIQLMLEPIPEYLLKNDFGAKNYEFLEFAI